MKNSVLYSLSLFLFASSLLFLSGCRFGNHADEAQPLPRKDSYLSKEYFSTEAKTFQTKVTFNDSGGNLQTSTNPQTSLSAVPARILQVFTNPHVFAMIDDADKTPIFVNYGWTDYYETKIENGNTIAYEAPSGVFTFMYDSTCKTQSLVTMEGALDRTHPSVINLGGGEILNIAGRTQLDFTYSRVLTGNCHDDLYLLAYCYINGAGCNTDELQFSHDILDLYVNQGGVLNINDVVNLKSLEYKVHFE